jgi:alanine dehydrogenase
MDAFSSPGASACAGSPLLWAASDDARRIAPAAPIDPRVVATAVRSALRDVAVGVARGGKLVLEVPPPVQVPAAPPVPMHGERSNWKLSTLVALNATHGAVKIVGSNAANRARGLPRSQSLLVLYDKPTMRPLAIFDGTTISAARTAAYASVIVDAMQRTAPIDVFLFGAGVLAGHILADLQALQRDAIGTVHVRSLDHARTQAFVARHRPTVDFGLVAVAGNRVLHRCALIITASNAAAPVFERAEAASDAVVLHLGGDETPPGFIALAQAAGQLYCDDAAAVAHRNSQSVARYFAERGQSLAHDAQALGIRPVGDLVDATGVVKGPALVTCVGLPALDLYVLLALQGGRPGVRGH